MFIVIAAILGLITAPITINKMEKANQASLKERQHDAFKEAERKIEKEYGLPHRPTLGEVK